MKNSIVGIACMLSALFLSIVQAANAALPRAGLPVGTNSPEEFSAQIRNDVLRWCTVIEKNHITVQ
ncbi:hypothetical protein [Variovorax sp. Root411]|uniref:hypothetical protein n=1 Tax=Variovorax sp. Root411 TaxID=1736530 RepID=UPI0012FACF0A|nr:hypothetical protein [Variovorax sp. Root411]